MSFGDSTWHLKWAAQVNLIDSVHAALHLSRFSFKAANTAISTPINYSLSPLPSYHFTLFGKMTQTRKHFFLILTLTVIFLGCFLRHQITSTLDTDWCTFASHRAFLDGCRFFSPFPLLQNMNHIYLLIYTLQACCIFISSSKHLQTITAELLL